MADPSQAKPAPPAAPPGGELDARVTALLDEMQQASDRMIRHLDREGAPDARGQPSSRTGGAPDELGKAVDQMIADAKAAGRPSGALAALDAEIAHRADDLIEGEIADESQVLAAAAVPAPTPPPPIAPPPAAVAPPPIPAPSRPAAAPMPPPEPVVEKPIAAVVTAAPAVRPARSDMRDWVLARLAVVSAPLSRRPHLRPWIGYLAIWTLFNAACLLGYNFFVREPAPPRPPVKAASHSKDGDGHGEKPKSDGHGAAKADTHGEKADSHAKPDAHGKTAKAAPKKTRSALPKKKKNDAHAGGH